MLTVNHHLSSLRQTVSMDQTILEPFPDHVPVLSDTTGWGTHTHPVISIQPHPALLHLTLLQIANMKQDRRCTGRRPHSPFTYHLACTWRLLFSFQLSVRYDKLLCLSSASGDAYYLAIGGGVAEHNWNHIKTVLQDQGFRCELTDHSEDMGMISIQGPKRCRTKELWINEDMIMIYIWWERRQLIDVKEQVIVHILDGRGEEKMICWIVQMRAGLFSRVGQRHKRQVQGNLMQRLLVLRDYKLWMIKSLSVAVTTFKDWMSTACEVNIRPLNRASWMFSSLCRNSDVPPEWTLILQRVLTSHQKSYIFVAPLSIRCSTL